MTDIVIYQTESGKNRLDVRLENGNIWLSQEQISTLFNKAKSTISEHIKKIFEEGELSRHSVVRNYRTTASDGKNYDVSYYNLDVIIAVGYRVRSAQGTQFRIWATEVLTEYLTKGFAMDDDRLKEDEGGLYWKELLERIRDIRSSEKVFYRQVLDLYATSRDYEAKDEKSLLFFKTVQNKLHFATHGQTAAELIYSRVDADKEFMGLTTFKGALPRKADAQTAKNYLSEKELRDLNLLVSGYFDFAERYAERHEHLYMQDYLDHLDKILQANGDAVLHGAGHRSHKQAMNKVDAEYAKYQEKTLSPVEKDYLESIKALESKAKTQQKKGKNNV